MVDSLGLSERQACRIVGLNRATWQYEPKPESSLNKALRVKIREIAAQRRRFGSFRIWQMLIRQGWTINKKRVQRLWREEGLRNPLRKRRKRARGHSENSCAMKKAEYKNHVWCWDFTMDETAEGRRLKWFSVVDEFTRECLALEVERRMTAREIGRASCRERV